MRVSFVQCEISRGNQKQVVWIEDVPSIKVGEYISLEGDKKEWRIDTLGSKEERYNDVGEIFY